MESARLVADLTAMFVQALMRILAAVAAFGDTEDGRTLEEGVEQEMKALGAAILEAAWRIRMKERPAPPSLPCACGHRKHRIRRQACTVQGILGPIELQERYYYYCDHCKSSGFWGDELRGRGRFTPLAEERMVLMGTEAPYGVAAQVLKGLGVLEVAGSTIRRLCVALGQQLRRRQEAEVAAQYGAGAAEPEETPEGLAIALDGAMMGRVDIQPRQRKSRSTGRKVPGKKSLQNFFHEVKTRVVFNFGRKGEAVRKTFYATQARVEEFRQQAIREATRRGADVARRLVVLGDGAPWVWKTAQECFPKALQILDWYHAVEHLWAVGRARYGTDVKKVQKWVKQHETELWEGEVRRVIVAVRKVSAELGVPNQALSEEARETDPRWIVFRNIGYFEENQRRMDYPRYRAESLPIGSGAVESACKHVVATRLKRSGMRWDEEGGESILALRCERLSSRWDHLWSTRGAA